MSESIRSDFLKVCEELVVNLSVTVAGRKFEVPVKSLGNCELFTGRPQILLRPYTVKCRGNPNMFRLFLSLIARAGAIIPEEQCENLESLCEEFGFRSVPYSSRARSVCTLLFEASIGSALKARGDSMHNERVRVVCHKDKLPWFGSCSSSRRESATA